MMKYIPQKIEKKWQKYWEKEKTFKDYTRKEVFYALDMFPYPSGAGLHVGHPKGYVATDIVSRFEYLRGKSVLHPMGWDAFGLPAENYAIKNKIHPKKAVEENIKRFKEQLQKIGFTYDWDREINTTDPEYYRWTQWIFLKMFEKGLAYESEEPVNWCASCKTVLANEDLEQGKCERCGGEITQRPLRQWVLKMTDYAERLLSDLETEDIQWEKSIIEQQKNWIGRSEGVELTFPISFKNEEKKKVLILHGFEGDPLEGWKPWLKQSLEKIGYKVYSPKLPHFSHPDYEEVMTFLRDITKNFSENDSIIGHSLGGHFALKLAEEKVFKKIILVAPTIGGFSMPYDTWKEEAPNSDFDSCRRVLEDYPVVFKKIKTKEKIAIFGEDDQGIPIEHSYILDDSWTIIRKPNTGHMSHEKSIQEIFSSITQDDFLKVFTTRVDTIFGCTYVVVAPEHTIIKNEKLKIKNYKEVEEYIEQAKKKTAMERGDLNKEKSGVQLEGVEVINPFTGESVPVFVADYVLGSYGTGAVMAVPAHDERDWEFAKKYELPLRNSIAQETGEKQENPHFRSASYGIIENDKQEILLQFLTKYNRWILPGGGVELGESRQEALFREIREETGYTDCELIQEVGVARAQYFGIHSQESKCADVSLFRLKLLSEKQQKLDWDDREKEIGMEHSWISSKQALDYFAQDPTSKVIFFDIFERYVSGKYCFIGDGILVDSGEFTGLTSKEAREKMANWLEERELGKQTVQYKMRDWVFSRQRYWGEPIPLIHCKKCGVVGVPEKDLPLKLPEVLSYEPTDTGESPLASIEEWVNTLCPICGGKAKRETNTMPQWAGSSWYYLAYIMREDPEFKIQNTPLFQQWLPVDLYVGGAEHATRHLLYARFWHKFLYDIGIVTTKEPFKRLVHVGLINAEDGRKMSKRWDNVINPDDVVAEFGADALRLYEMFMGPFTQNISWNTESVSGVRRFLEKVWKLFDKVSSEDEKVYKKDVETLFHKTLKKVTKDIEEFRFNTAISSMMIFVNSLEKEASLDRDMYEKFLILLSPFTPHIVEELWEKLGKTKSIFLQQWPVWDETKITDEIVNVVFQVNGKVRDIQKVSVDISEEDLQKRALENEKVQKHIQGKEIRKIIFVKGRLINIVV